MTGRTCDKERAVRSMVRSGQDDPALRDHLARCESCRQDAEVAAWMIAFAELPAEPARLPDPGLLWWKAQLLRRWQAERAASAPIERMRWVELAAGFASLAAFLVWQWQSLVNLVARAIPAGVAAASAAPQGASPVAILLVLLGTASVGAMFVAALHRRLGGESS